MKNLRAAWPAQTAGVRAEDFVFIDVRGVNRAMMRRRRPSPRERARLGLRPAQLGR